MLPAVLRRSHSQTLRVWDCSQRSEPPYERPDHRQRRFPDFRVRLGSSLRVRSRSPRDWHLSRVLLRTLLSPVRKFCVPRSAGIENHYPDRPPAAKIHVVLDALRGEDIIAGIVPH